MALINWLIFYLVERMRFRSYISKVLRKAKLTYTFVYVKRHTNKRCGCFHEVQTIRNAVVYGEAFNIYLSYKPSGHYVRLKTTKGNHFETHFQTSDSVENCAIELLKVYSYANNKEAFDDYIKRIEANKKLNYSRNKEFEQAIKDRLPIKVSGVSLEEIKDIKDWDNLKQGKKDYYLTIMLFNKDLKKIYIDFLMGVL